MKEIKICNDGSIEIDNIYGFHPLDLSLKDRLKMIHSLTITEEIWLNDN